MLTTAIFPSYVGSKKYYIPYLQEYAGRDFVELFAGSAALSMSLAQKAILVDKDPIVANIIQNFDKQIVDISYMDEDFYYQVRSSDEWWRYTFLLQKFSFSGVFRYSKNGFNVPMKKQYRTGEKFPLDKIQDDYQEAFNRWEILKLQDSTFCEDYLNIGTAYYSSLNDPIIVFDPPYESSQAAYNNNKFDYDKYWGKVRSTILDGYDVIIFDTVDNLVAQGFQPTHSRKMRVNGKHKGNSEGIYLTMTEGLF